MAFKRIVIAYKRFFLDFYGNQPAYVQKKIEWTLKFIEVTRHVPEKYFKHISSTKGLYEIRVEHGTNIYRIFAFFNKGNLIVLGNAFKKKTQKTPKKEIEKALLIIKEYTNEKNR